MVRRLGQRIAGGGHIGDREGTRGCYPFDGHRITEAFERVLPVRSQGTSIVDRPRAALRWRNVQRGGEASPLAEGERPSFQGERTCVTRLVNAGQCDNFDKLELNWPTGEGGRDSLDFKAEEMRKGFLVGHFPVG